MKNRPQTMNLFRQVAVVGALLLGAALSLPAQTGSVSATSVKRTTDGRILQPDNSSSPTASATGQIRPANSLPPEITQQLKKFEIAREAFITRQEQLRKQLQGASSDKERDAIRARIKDSLEQWRDQARQFRDEAKQRMKELQRELPSLREALQEGGTGTDVKPGGRPRPGID